MPSEDDPIIRESAAAVAAIRSSSSLGLEDVLVGISSEAADNAATASIGSIRGGQLRVVGFATADGYVRAIRNGVPERTHRVYLQTLRERFRWAEAEIRALPGPHVGIDRPIGPGIAHVSSGVPLFDRPPSERRFVVGQPGAAPESRPPPRQAPPAPSPAAAPFRPKRPQLVRIMAGSSPVLRRPPAPVRAPVRAPDPRPAPAPAIFGPPPSSASQNPGSAAEIPPVADPGSRGDETRRSTGDDAADRFALLELD